MLVAYLQITGFNMFGLRWPFRRQVKKTVRTALYVAEAQTKLTETVVTEVKTESAVAQEIISHILTLWMTIWQTVVVDVAQQENAWDGTH